ncbi:hypothetical protein DRJ22_02485 [Candidatus Woesearchaeota archaeon]|nr:MAG: hypothetical protein DRJ22_02485 [Candidatus Woesearchaeota archaeon]
MTGLVKKITRLLKPYYSFNNWEDFKDFTWDYVTGEKKYKKLVEKAETDKTFIEPRDLGYGVQKILQNADESKKKELAQRLEEITKSNWEKFGKKYFTKRPLLSKLSRYAAIGGATVGGAATAAALLGASLPLSPVAGVGVLLAGGVLNVLNDIYDAFRAEKAMNPDKNEGDSYFTKVLNYIKKIPQKIAGGVKYVWDVVTSPFRKDEAKTAGALLEGLITSAAPVGGAALGYSDFLIDTLGPAMTPIQVASFVPLLYKTLKGGKSFDYAVVKYIRELSQQEFINEVYNSKDKVMPLRDVVKEQELSANNAVYDLINKTDNPGKQLDYVKPRKAA